MACRLSSRMRRTTKRYGLDDSDDEIEDDTAPDDTDDTDPDDTDDTDPDDTDSDGIDDDTDSDGNEPDAAAPEAWHFVNGDTDTGPPVVQFTGQSGWQNGITSEDFSIEDYIHEFLPDELFEHLSRWTNSRATIEDAERCLEDKCSVNWQPVEAETMKIFFGITLLMPLVKKSYIKDYWATEAMLDTPYFRTCMSRDRYASILKFIRFSDPYQVDKAIKKTRLIGLWEIHTEICKKYAAHHEICLDESLILFKGRIHFKMFIRIKRARFGIKLFVLTDVHGYMISAVVYYGAASDVICDEPGIQELSKSEIIVVLMLSDADMLDKGYTVTLDNWYCSVRLVTYLHTRLTLVRGTCRTNRGIPAELVQKKLVPISTCYMRKGPILAIKFADKKDVYFITTADAAGEVQKSRTLRGGARIDYNKPTAIDLYNHTMGGVDITDQFLSYISVMRKTHAWFKKLGLNMIQRLLLNAFILYNQEKEKISFYAFTKKAIAIFAGMPSEPNRGRQQRTAVRRCGPELQPHNLERIPATNAKQRPQRKCKQCGKNGIRRETSYQCNGCPSKPALCVTCVGDWHN